MSNQSDTPTFTVEIIDEEDPEQLETIVEAECLVAWQGIRAQNIHIINDVIHALHELKIFPENAAALYRKKIASTDLDDEKKEEKQNAYARKISSYYQWIFIGANNAPAKLHEEGEFKNVELPQGVILEMQQILQHAVTHYNHELPFKRIIDAEAKKYNIKDPKEEISNFVNIEINQRQTGGSFFLGINGYDLICFYGACSEKVYDRILGK